MLHLKGYGFKEVGKPPRVTPDTLFGIGSCTKAMTATSLPFWWTRARWAGTNFTSASTCRSFAWPIRWPTARTLRDLLCHRTGLLRHDLLWYRPVVVGRVGAAPGPPRTDSLVPRQL